MWKKRWNTLIKTNQNYDFFQFVEEHFDAEGTELETWLPEDWTPEPEFISQLRKPALKGLARRINRLWKDLSRKIKDEVKENPSLYSIIYVPNGFIVPGGKGAFINDVRQGQGSEGVKGDDSNKIWFNGLLSTQDLMKISKKNLQDKKKLLTYSSKKGPMIA